MPGVVGMTSPVFDGSNPKLSRDHAQSHVRSANLGLALSELPEFRV